MSGEVGCENPAVARFDFPSGIEVIRTAEGLSGEVREFWERHQDYPDHDIDYFRGELTSMPGVKRPHVLVLRAQGAIRAVVVGRIRSAPLHWKLGYLEAIPRPVDTLEVMYGGFLGDIDADTAQTLVKALQASLRDDGVALATISYIGVDSPVHRALLEVPPRALRDTRAEPVGHYVLDLEDSVDAFLASRSKSTRGQLRNKRNRIEKKYGDALVVHGFRDVSDVQRAAKMVETISATTYQRRIGVSVEDSPEQRAYWRMLAERGWMRIFVLCLEDRPVAFWSGVKYRGSFAVSYTGFDPEFSDDRPGRYLLLKMIEEFCAEGATRVDYGWGFADYKKQLGTRSFDEVNVYVFAPSPAGLALKAARSGLVRANDGAKRVLERYDVLDKVKKVLRR